MSLQRLQKVLAAAGVASRRACEDLISEGRVEVDGEVVDVLGTQVDPLRAEIRVDGERVRLEKPQYHLLNKPRGVICSARARPDTPKAVDYAPHEARDIRLFTIGRLDVESEGAIILTNDGELCHMVTHPRFGIEKTYRVEVDGLPDDDTLDKMRKGAWLAEGRTGELDVRLVARKSKRAVLEVKLREGMKREIRRVCARHGHEVRRLKRVAIGPVRLGSLAVGATRALTPREIAELRDCGDVVVRLGGGSPRGRSSARARGDAPRRHRHGHDVDGADRAPRGKALRPRKKSGASGKPGGKPVGKRGGKSGGKQDGGRSGTRGASGGARTSGAGGTGGAARKSTARGKSGGARKSASPHGASRKSTSRKATSRKPARGTKPGGKSGGKRTRRGR